MSIVGARVSERLRVLGRSQGWLAAKVGMRQTGIQAIIAGRSKRPKKLREIATALKTTQEYLLGETDDPAIPGAEKALSTEELAEMISRLEPEFRALLEAAIEGLLHRRSDDRDRSQDT